MELTIRWPLPLSLLMTPPLMKRAPLALPALLALLVAPLSLVADSCYLRCGPRIAGDPAAALAGSGRGRPGRPTKSWCSGGFPADFTCRKSRRRPAAPPACDRPNPYPTAWVPGPSLL
jgi:hypothetical protein